MSNKHYDEVSVVRALSRKSSIRITTNGAYNHIQILKDATDVGNGSWGKIDYLTKVHGYIPVRVDTFVGRRNHINANSEDNHSVVDTKTAKREKKFNMATMAKNAMKRVKSK